uniref:Uncharacterized protein n=1 Tax=Anopheles arabiensis TaxID=7173 RepID=A0A182IGJ0_ANOAR
MLFVSGDKIKQIINLVSGYCNVTTVCLTHPAANFLTLIILRTRSRNHLSS